MASSGATFTLPAECDGGRTALARKLLEHKFELEPRAKLHLPYSAIPLWQGNAKLPQRERAYHLHHVRNERINRVTRQANHFRAYTKKEHKRKGLRPMSMQFSDCPLGLTWAVMTGKK